MRPPIFQPLLKLGLVTLSATARLIAQDLDHFPAASDTVATPLYDNLGTLHHAITTDSPLSQKYFDQGLRLTYAFNHDEAIKSFKEGIRHDSTCAMCYWGIAYALGANINLPMDTAAAAPAYQASQQALEYSGNVTPNERAYIEALTKRYSSDPTTDRARLDSAWAKAIGQVSRKYPKDDDAGALYAEALMDLRPWNYWTNGGKPKAPSTLEQLAVAERVLKRSPDHPGACHFYIHAIEASRNARKALACAQRLGTLMPGAGHLVHMPTHIYIKLGRWDLAAENNAHAVHVDEGYILAQHPTGVYPTGYYPHNYHVMWYALNMLGRSEDAIDVARKLISIVPAEVVRQIPSFESYSPTLLYTLARFSRWDQILQQPAPPADLRYTTGAWHYVRGLAYTAQGNLDSAAVERDSLVAIAEATPAALHISQNSVKVVLGLAQSHLAGEIAARQGQTEEAVLQLKRAVGEEDELTYDEPPAWYLPIRQRLGAVLLAAGRPKDAEKIFKQDLEHRPENGWSLHGLLQALRAQNRTKDAALVEARFEKAWARADVQLADR